MSKTALLIIDIQNDYFPGGSFALPSATQAGENAGRLLGHFRQLGLPVIHVRHESVRPGANFFLPGTPGAEIHACVAPILGEPVVVKHKPNSFLETGLDGMLRDLGVSKLVVCGMMTNMCVDAGVRAASDLGYACVLAHDACAAADLSFQGVVVSAAQVHAAFTAALAFGYAATASREEIIAGGSELM